MQSALGSGTSFLLKMPISFSMTQLMVVEIGAERYGIPISDIVETHKLPLHDIQAIRSGRAFILRDQTIPLLDLAELLQMPTSHPASHDLKVMIVQSEGQRFGIAIDAIAERAETLTRPLTGLLQGIAGIAGTTLLGDGRVLLVLNLEELVQ
jgi:two-component system chemotaxis sensor kinase CheA